MIVMKSVLALMGTCVSNRVWHIKRLLFTVTLFTHLARQCDFTYQAQESSNLKKLNHVLRLSRLDDTLLVPTSIAGLVWSTRRCGDIPAAAPEVDPAMVVCEQYAKRCPQWMKYDIGEMVRDAFQVLLAQRALVAKA